MDPHEEYTQRWLAAIVESSDDAIISKTLDGIITSWNSGAERLFGYAPDEVVGRSITIIIPADRIEEEFLILERLKRGERIDHFQTIRRAKSGRLLSISLTVSPIRDDDGRIVGASKVARDISIQKAAEVALRESAARKDDFIAILGHELRNPLASIRNGIDIMRTHVQAPELRWVTEMLDRQTAHLVRLVDDLLDASRVARGKVALVKQRINVNDLVRRSVDSMRPIIDERKHEARVVESAEPLEIDADSVRIAQALTNLLSNAARYTEPGGRIIVDVSRNGAMARVRVIDNGMGIPEWSLPIIFEMFAQGHSVREATVTGLGVGLPLARALIELHGGTLEAFSAGEGKGSEFTINLPLATTLAMAS